MLLRRVGERVGPRALHLLGLSDLLEPADRIRIVDELGRGLLDPVEERPPDGLPLAVVVVEQLRRELLARVEQPRTQCRPLGLLLPDRLRLLYLGRRERPELRERLRAPLEQPVAQEQGRDAVLPVVGVDLVEE